jgi:hypothetical protein
MSSHFIRIVTLLALAALATAIVAMQAPIEQSEDYHRFADGRTLAGFPNFWNVASNLGFIAAGLYGLSVYFRSAPAIDRVLRPAYFTIFAGAVLIGLGSGYYHYAPDTPRLVWDRLPMTITFMGIFAVVIGEYIDSRWGARLFLPLGILGIASVAYWDFTEQAGQGDLRPYALVQFLPMLLIPLILLLFRPGRLSAPHIWGVLGVYAAAKACELYDHGLLAITGLSGHTFKHLVAAVGIGLLALAVRKKHAN